MPHAEERANVPESLALDHRRIVHFERLFPPKKVYQQRTDGMANCVELQQTDWDALCDCTDMLEQLLQVLQRDLQGCVSHTTRYALCNEP